MSLDSIFVFFDPSLWAACFCSVRTDDVRFGTQNPMYVGVGKVTNNPRCDAREEEQQEKMLADNLGVPPHVREGKMRLTGDIPCTSSRPWKWIFGQTAASRN